MPLRSNLFILMSDRKRVLSCIQPTGEMHFGNYFGAVANWVKLQEEYDCVYGVVDYHAMTTPYNAQKLRANTWDIIFTLLATGVNAENLFIQSMIPEHTELCWILNCMTSYGMLTRMTQFKDKSVNQSSNADGFISAGLFDYPVLQAADILIYHADYVPVGKDQEQHLELSRNIASRFNQSFKKEYFVHPEPLFTEIPKVQSTADPTRKMSKSAGSKHYIAILDDAAAITKKIKSAVTDTGEVNRDENGTRIMSPGVANLMSMMRAAGATDVVEQMSSAFEDESLRYGDLKVATAEALVNLVTPIQERRKELLADKKNVKAQIKASSAQVRKRAIETLKEVRDLAGLMPYSAL